MQRHTISQVSTAELVIKKSRFIAQLQPISSHAEGLAVVDQLWQQYPDARHICYAMLVNGQLRQSDDGEPSGTAARPMMNVLQHKGLDNVLATVVRYFGGIKLGAGGLVRAYSQAVNDAVSQAELTEVKTLDSQRIRFEFAVEAQVRHQATQHQLEIEIQYRDKVEAQLTGEQQPLNDCLEQLNNQLRGELELLPTNEPSIDH